MCAGGHGYFDTLLADSRFGGQRGSSHFILRNQHWQLIGIVSGYHSPDAPNLSEDQRRWLGQAVDEAGGERSRQTVLLSHHQAFTAFGDTNVSGKLAADVGGALNGQSGRLDLGPRTPGHGLRLGHHRWSDWQRSPSTSDIPNHVSVWSKPV